MHQSTSKCRHVLGRHFICQSMLAWAAEPPIAKHFSPGCHLVAATLSSRVPPPPGDTRSRPRMSLSSPRTASTKCSSNSLKPDWEMRDWWKPKKGAKDVTPQGLLGEGGARKRAVPPKPPQFRWQSKPGKYRYKINALNSVSYYVWFFRKRKKKIFCGTFSLTLLLGRWECFLTLGFVDICISCIKWRKHQAMEIDGLGYSLKDFFLEALVVGGWSVRLWAVILYSGQCAGQARCTS